MTSEDHWTRALAASAVAQSEGFTETAKAFAELAKLAIEAEDQYQIRCCSEGRSCHGSEDTLPQAPTKALG